MAAPPQEAWDGPLNPRTARDLGIIAKLRVGAENQDEGRRSWRLSDVAQREAIEMLPLGSSGCHPSNYWYIQLGCSMGIVEVPTSRVDTRVRLCTRRRSARGRQQDLDSIRSFCLRGLAVQPSIQVSAARVAARTSPLVACVPSKTSPWAGITRTNSHASRRSMLALSAERSLA